MNIIRMSLAEYQYLARGIFHDVINCRVNMLYITSYTSRRICHKYQVHGLRFCFTYNSRPGIARLHYAFVHSSYALFSY